MPRGRTDWFGARLPIADPPKPPTRCDRNPAHVGGIRFELHRYGRKAGQIYLCQVCIRDLILIPDPDPRFVEETA
jgi:hypothetical protein